MKVKKRLRKKRPMQKKKLRFRFQKKHPDPSVKYLIVGIGNVGDNYANTRHNIGFSVLDAFAEASGFSFLDKRYGFIAQHKYKARQLYFLKPSTYVNLSGRAVNYWLKKLKITPEKMLVIVDDVALPFGKMRLRTKGGHGGHNGLLSIIETLGHQQFSRLRIGIGNEFMPGQQVNYVLSEWDETEKTRLPEVTDSAQEIIKSFVAIGPERTMNVFNKR